MLISTSIHPKDYQFGIISEMVYSYSGTVQFPLWFKYFSTDYKINENVVKNEVISSTFGKYAHGQGSLIKALLDERKAENDREKRKFPNQNEQPDP